MSWQSWRSSNRLTRGSTRSFHVSKATSTASPPALWMSFSSFSKWAAPPYSANCGIVLLKTTECCSMNLLRTVNLFTTQIVDSRSSVSCCVGPFLQALLYPLL
jgi:hypothetical protein